MQDLLIKELNALKHRGIASAIVSRYNEFKSFADKGEEEWFSELCFCLTTANSSAMMGQKVQNALGFEGFYSLSQKKLTKSLKDLGYRFYNKRAEYIVGARKHFGIKEKLDEIGATASEGAGGAFNDPESGFEADGGNRVESDLSKAAAIDRAKRDYLFENVKGFGLKEASHFLRNTGHDNCAILDRHIIRLMHEHGMIPQVPKTITERNYFAIESELDKFSAKAGMNHSLLDLYLWYLKTGKVLK